MSASGSTGAASVDPALGQLVDEMAARVRAGEAVDPEVVARAHPEFAEELRDILPALALLADAVHSVGDASVPKRTAPAGDEVIPGLLGDFRIVREVGRGGMGVVYEAEQISLRRRVALKVLPWAAAMDAKQLQRFKNEALAAASLKHDHIVQVYAVGCERGVHFYAMEFIDGVSLAHVIAAIRDGAKNIPAPPEPTIDYHPARSAPGVIDTALHVPALHESESVTPATVPNAALSTQFSGPNKREIYRTAARLIADAAGALEHAHLLGIVHRDVKPGNLLVDQGGKVWVTDFGLARFGADAGLTMSGDLLGTLRYMAPEQVLARHGLVDHRADVYALGCTLYELLSGRPMVAAKERAEILRKIAFEDPPALRKRDRAIPEELETVTLKALAKNPAERYATARELADDLRRWLEDKPINAKPPNLLQRSARQMRRHPKVVAATFAVLLLAATGAMVGAVLIDRQKVRAEAAYARARLALDELSAHVIDDWLAMQPALTDDQKQFLERSLGHYEWLARQPAADAETRVGVAAAHLRAGDIRAKLGQSSDAEAAYARAVELYQRLSDELPLESAYRLALAKAHCARGGTLRQVARLKDAESAYQQALALHEQLVSEASTQWEYRYELAGTLLAYAELLRQSGRASEAVKLYRRGLDVVQRQPQRTPAALYRLGQLHVRLGSLLYYLGHDADGEQAARRGVETLESLLKSVGNGPGTGLYREALADGLTELAHTLGTAGVWNSLSFGGLNRPDEAEAADRRAVEIWEKLAADFPAVPEYRHRLARSIRGLGIHLGDQGRYPDAQVEYRRAVILLEKLAADQPGEPRYRVSLAETFRALGFVSNRARQPVDADLAYRGAIRAYREASRLLPEVARVHIELALILREMGDPDGAIAEYGAALKLDPDHVVALNSLGCILNNEKRDYDGAIAYFRRAIALAPNFANAHANLGRVLCDAKRDYDGGIDCLRRAIALDPRNAAAHLMLGEVLRGKGQFDEAIAEYRQVNRLMPNHVSSYVDLGAILCDEKHDYDGAIVCFRRAIALDPEHTTAHVNLGITLRKMGQTDAAVAEYREAIRLDPNNLVANINLGAYLSDVKGDYDGAIGCFRRAIDRGPNNWRAHNNLSITLERAGQYAAAEAAFREADKLQPDEARCQEHIAWHLAACPDVRLRDPKQAVAAAKKAVELELQNGGYWNTLGVAYYRNGEYPAAIEALGRSIKLSDGGSAAAWFFLAMAHQRQGDKEDACRWYDKAADWMTKNGPDNPHLRRFRAEAEQLLGMPPPTGP
jgi:tetratricopeptide (TPR) repeat protein